LPKESRIFTGISGIMPFSAPNLGYMWEKKKTQGFQHYSIILVPRSLDGLPSFLGLSDSFFVYLFFF
jgi:hypothetical protein